MKVFFTCIFLFLFNNNFVATAITTIYFHHLINKQELVLNKNYVVENDTLQIQTLKYYISAIQFLKNGKCVWKEKNSFHLINVEEENTNKICLNNANQKIQFDAIQFSIGIDSGTNSDGIKGGNLDPIKGMYWTWQNGYIHFKMEGTNVKCPTRNNQFQFHIGGYSYPNETMQTVVLPCINSNEINIQVAIEKLLQQIDFTTSHTIMQPCKEAVLFATKLPTIFSLQQ